MHSNTEVELIFSEWLICPKPCITQTHPHVPLSNNHLSSPPDEHAPCSLTFLREATALLTAPEPPPFLAPAAPPLMSVLEPLVKHESERDMPVPRQPVHADGGVLYTYAQSTYLYMNILATQDKLQWQSIVPVTHI